MLESLLFILLLSVSALFIVIALIVMLIAVIRKSSALKKTALKISIIPILCWVLIAIWYLITLPSIRKSEMENFAGTYILNSSDNGSLKKSKSRINGFKLILFDDGTYLFDGHEKIGLQKHGTWKTDGTDGLFEFYNENGNLSQWATPYGNDNNYSLSIEYQKGQDSKTILFVKIKSE
ncbi:hypothetical protein A1704_23160 [Chryseobacterium cucumeris]|uniref:hypothetical protein n=1 Tax=Chryseobacterium cucumeris TaxID=1813611 RepID=UPI0007884477|nr:hypothetical protein [Chryseobacterium cucumeris]KYH06715.1 hypothetical protein A1704_23160 [Chryseobacterium cucumeris]